MEHPECGVCPPGSPLPLQAQQEAAAKELQEDAASEPQLAGGAEDVERRAHGGDAGGRLEVGASPRTALVPGGGAGLGPSALSVGRWPGVAVLPGERRPWSGVT